MRRRRSERRKLAGAAGFASFVYLEALDASFSLDGVLGAFAISSDIVVVAIGLGVGAVFVRSLTVYLVRHDTRRSLPYLAHGAHWAIGALGVFLLGRHRALISRVAHGRRQREYSRRGLGQVAAVQD